MRITNGHPIKKAHAKYIIACAPCQEVDTVRFELTLELVLSECRHASCVRVHG